MIYDKEHYNQVLEVARSYRNDVERLEKQLAITQKALELACEHIKEDLKCDDTQDEIYNYFKNKAKEMLENE